MSSGSTCHIARGWSSWLHYYDHISSVDGQLSLNWHLCIVSVATSVEFIVLPTDTFICKRHDCSRIYCSEDSGTWISLECFCIETSMNAVSWYLVSTVKDVEMQVTVNIYTVCNSNYAQSTPLDVSFSILIWNVSLTGSCWRREG
jgi:hypothetical protein